LEQNRGVVLPGNLSLFLALRIQEEVGVPGFALKAPSGAFIPNTARHSRGVSLHRGPPAPKAENQRSPALVGADFDDSALTVGHLR
jgi:hypothetical protein